MSDYLSMSDDAWEESVRERAIAPVSYLALRAHIQEHHPEIYLGLRNDVLNARHQATGCRTPIAGKS